MVVSTYVRKDSGWVRLNIHPSFDSVLSEEAEKGQTSLLLEAPREEVAPEKASKRLRWEILLIW